MRVDPTVFPFVARCYSKLYAQRGSGAIGHKLKKALFAMQQQMFKCWHDMHISHPTTIHGMVCIFNIQRFEAT